MHVEIQFKKILESAGKAKHGRIQEIADDLGVNRHTIRKLYNNQARNVSLETIGKLCDWLEERHLCEGLPGALFAARPSQLMRAVAEPRLVTMYLGEYRSEGFPRQWVSRDDAAAASMIVQQLSRLGPSAPQFTHIHVPSHVPVGPGRVKASDLAPDIKAAQQIFARMRSDQSQGTSVLIGSQRANYLVELFVSELFRCDGFTARGSTVPFYLKYQEPERVESCFGGDRAPTRRGAEASPGIFYRPQGRGWLCAESLPGRRGAGIVIIRREPGLGRLEIAVFGLSAIATAAMGKILCEGPDRFWSLTGSRGGIEVGIYVCSFPLSGLKTGEESIDLLRIGPAEIVRLDVALPRMR
ncbi:MAG: helix-turn-helix domain-containing protein [Planctomycetota bacterium]|jgi:DNA-binding Xre family transcriptional regulator